MFGREVLGVSYAYHFEHLSVLSQGIFTLGSEYSPLKDLTSRL